MNRLLAAACASALLTLSATGCGGGSATSLAAQHVTVFAAASLQPVFGGPIAAAYARTPGREVSTSFAGSQSLVAQIEQGAPADVLATADMTTMAQVRSRLVAPPRVFARNRLVIVTAKGNPHHITRLRDLAQRGLIVVLADPSVPAGKYAAQALAAAHVTVHPKSLEDNVRGVLFKVELGQADAGIVYVTDARSVGTRVASVPIPNSPVASYPIGALTVKGKAFVDFVLSAPAQSILRRAGFLPP